MKNQDNKDFEKHMEKNPQVHPDFLEFFKKHTETLDIKGPGLNKFILLTLFNLNKFINRQQKGGDGSSDATTEDTGDSNATTETEKRSSQRTTEESRPENSIVRYGVDNQVDLPREDSMAGDEVGFPREDDMGDEVGFPREDDMGDEVGFTREDDMGDEVGFTRDYGMVGDVREDSKSNKIEIMLKFVWFSIFICLLMAIYVATDEFLKIEINPEKAIFEAFDKLEFKDYTTLNAINEFKAFIEEDNKNNNYELVPSVNTPVDGTIMNIFQDSLNEISNELVVYDAEIPVDAVIPVEEDRTIVIFGDSYNINDLVSYDMPEPITIKDIAMAVFQSDPTIITRLSTVATYSLGTVMDSIEEKAMDQLKNLPNQIKEETLNRLYNEETTITQRAAQLYQFTKLTSVFSFSSTIALTQLEHVTTDIHDDIKRYIEDIQKLLSRAMIKEYNTFIHKIVINLDYIRALIGSLTTVFIFPYFRTLWKKKNSTVSIRELEDNKASNRNRIENTTDSSDRPPSLKKIENK